MSESGGTPEDVGWQFDVDADAEELRIEHAASGSAFVLDADGGLRVPGEAADVEDVGAELHELRSTLASALEAEPGTVERRDEADVQSSCRVECNQRGEVVIESPSRISLDAPVIDISSDGQLTATSKGVLTLEGALIQLN